MWPVHSIRHCDDIRNRAPRREFLWFVIVWSVLVKALTITALVFYTPIDGGAAYGGVMYIVWAGLVSIPFISLSVRRLHDIGFSGAWVLVLFLPVLGLLTLLILLSIAPGSSTNNQYGLPPVANYQDVWGAR